jgi:hypothetical protein
MIIKSSKRAQSLAGTSNIQVRHNSIYADIQGVLLNQEAWNNVVQGNSILGVSMAGIFLEKDTTGNRVMANKVLCAVQTECQTVSADEMAYENSKI